MTTLKLFVYTPPPPTPKTPISVFILMVWKIDAWEVLRWIHSDAVTLLDHMGTPKWLWPWSSPQNGLFWAESSNIRPEKVPECELQHHRVEALVNSLTPVTMVNGFWTKKLIKLDIFIVS